MSHSHLLRLARSPFSFLSSSFRIPLTRFYSTEEARNLRVGEYFSLERGSAAEQAVVYRVTSFSVVARGRGGTSIKFKLEDSKSGRVGIEVTLGTGGIIKKYSKEEVKELQDQWNAKKKNHSSESNQPLAPRPSSTESFDELIAWNFLYFDPIKESAHFMHPETFEQVEIGLNEPIYRSVAFVEEELKALKENAQVKFLKKEGKLVGFDFSS
jgi:translation elongation factor P/translation initiation factor 5A